VSEDDPTPEELKEAAALAAALEDGSDEARDKTPGDALEAAALLRFVHDSELDPERAAAIAEELNHLPDSDQSAGGSSDAQEERDHVISITQRRWWVIAPAVAAVSAAAVVAILWRPPASELPPPQLALLRAQSEVIGVPGADLAELQAQNNQYRRGWMVSMRDRYGGTQ